MSRSKDRNLLAIFLILFEFNFRFQFIVFVFFLINCWVFVLVLNSLIYPNLLVLPNQFIKLLRLLLEYFASPFRFYSFIIFRYPDSNILNLITVQEVNETFFLLNYTKINCRISSFKKLIDTIANILYMSHS